MSEYVAYLNGEWVDSDELRIDPRDRGFRTGDVVFDTAGTFDGVIFNTRLHAERLMRSLKYARIDSGLTTDEREAVMQEAVNAELVDGGGALRSRRLRTVI